VALTPVHGRIESEYNGVTGVAGPGEWILAATGIDGVHLRLVDVCSSHLGHQRSVEHHRTDLGVDEPSQPLVRFTGLTPTDAAMARTLGAAERFLRDLLSTPEVA
ncbi:hypothetical protein C6A85_71305, partial [Mycobacterium sp. ITM-2017-0098]